MSEKFGEIIPPSRSSRTSLEHSTIRPPQVGGLVSKWIYHFQAQTLRKQEEMFDSLVALIQAQERAVKAKIAFERTIVSLEFLDEIREVEREKVLAELEWERAKIRLKDDAILAEIAKSTADLHAARAEAYKRINPPEALPAPPPPPPTPKPDPIKERIHSALHGGKYARQAEKDIEEFIRERGDKLTEEDHDKIRNARLLAAKADEGRS